MKRHLLCVFLLISAVACQRVDRRAFRGVEKASAAIQRAFDTQTTLPAYQELLNAYTAELSAVHGHVTNPRERAVVAEYDIALKALMDVKLVREAQNARQSEMLPTRDELVARIAREYELGVNTNEPPSIYATEAVHAIWAAAREHLTKASMLLAG